MITLAQRARLQQELNYDVQQIRKLTPSEVLLTLEHGILPGNDDLVQHHIQQNELLLRQQED